MIKRRAFLAGALGAAAMGGQKTGAARAADNSLFSPAAELPGVKLWFTDTGGTGVPFILLHANTGTSAVWANQIESFSWAGYRVIAFDRRGWGQSIADPATGPQPGSIADDLDALVEYLKLDKFHLLGTAGGGFAALDYAAWHPELRVPLMLAAGVEKAGLIGLIVASWKKPYVARMRPIAAFDLAIVLVYAIYLSQVL